MCSRSTVVVSTSRLITFSSLGIAANERIGYQRDYKGSMPVPKAARLRHLAITFYGGDGLKLGTVTELDWWLSADRAGNYPLTDRVVTELQTAGFGLNEQDRFISVELDTLVGAALDDMSVGSVWFHGQINGTTEPTARLVLTSTLENLATLEALQKAAHKLPAGQRRPDCD
jgi:hypothetical protein